MSMFLVVAGDYYYPNGCDDIRAKCDSLEAAKKLVDDNHKNWLVEWVEIYSLDAMMIVAKAEIKSNLNRETKKFDFEPLKWELGK